MKMAKKNMTKVEILDTIRKMTEEAWSKQQRNYEAYGNSHEITKRSFAEWKALDDVCCELDIMY